MRHVESDSRHLFLEVIHEAERKGFPACSADFEGNGRMLVWGPGPVQWIDILSRAEFHDLCKIRDALLQLSRSPEVLGATFIRDIVDALVHSARLWARATIAEQALQPIEFARVVKAGCPAVIDGILTQHHDALLTFWRDTYEDAIDRPPLTAP